MKFLKFHQNAYFGKIIKKYDFLTRPGLPGGLGDPRIADLAIFRQPAGQGPPVPQPSPPVPALRGGSSRPQGGAALLPQGLLAAHRWSENDLNPYAAASSIYISRPPPAVAELIFLYNYYPPRPKIVAPRGPSRAYYMYTLA